MYRARVGRAKKIEGLGQLSQKGNCRARIKINLSELLLHALFLHLTHPPRVTCYCMILRLGLQGVSPHLTVYSSVEALADMVSVDGFPIISSPPVRPITLYLLVYTSSNPILY
jgi:hypothetical protein